MSPDGATKEVIDCTTGETTTVPATPEELAAFAAAQHAQQQQTATATFAVAEDAERLQLVRDRAAEDPAFAALADLVLGTKGVTT